MCVVINIFKILLRKQAATLHQCNVQIHLCCLTVTSCYKGAVAGGTTLGLRTNALVAGYGNVTWHLCHTWLWEPALVFHEEGVLVLTLPYLQLQRALP